MLILFLIYLIIFLRQNFIMINILKNFIFYFYNLFKYLKQLNYIFTPFVNKKIKNIKLSAMFRLKS